MQFDIEQFAGLPDSWRFWPCKYKAAIGDPYANPLPIEAALKKAKALKATGIGVVLPDKLALDLDGFNSDKTFEHNVEISVEKLPKSVAVTSGRPNRKQIFYNIPPQWRDLVEKQVFTLKGCGKVEFRTGRHYSLIAGIHPQDQKEWIDENGEMQCKKDLPYGTGDGTGLYEWVEGCSPTEVEVADAPPWLLEWWAEQKPVTKTKEVKYEASDSSEALLLNDSARVKWIFEYLSATEKHKFLPFFKFETPSDYECWNRVGMGLHHLSYQWEQLTKGEIKNKHEDDFFSWSERQENYDYSACVKKWNSAYKPDGGITFATIADYCRSNPKHPEHEDWLRRNKAELIKKGFIEEDQIAPPVEPPKRKRSELLRDLLEAAKTGDSDQYFEDFAEMESRFRRRPEAITTDLLNELRNDYSNFKSFTVGEVDMDKVDDLQYLLEGYLIKGENHQFYGGAGAGKTSLLAGMIKAGFRGKGFLNQTRPRQSFRTLWVACDGSTSRFKAAYKEAGLDPSMVDVWGADIKQGRTTFKFTIPNLIDLRNRLENKEKNYGFCVFDSVKGMLANSGFKYTDNEHVDLICQYLREIYGEPLGIAIGLINHLGADGVSGSGAKRWGEVVAQNVEIQPCKEGNKENHEQRRICIWKDPINGRKFFNYTFENGFFKPAESQEMVLNCYDKMKQYVQQINFKNGTTVFTRPDLLDIPDFERTQIDRNKDEHLKRGGIFRPFKDVKGKTVRGKWVLKKEFRLSKPEKEPDPIPQMELPRVEPKDVLTWSVAKGQGDKHAIVDVKSMTSVQVVNEVLNGEVVDI